MSLPFENGYVGQHQHGPADIAASVPLAHGAATENPSEQMPYSQIPSERFLSVDEYLSSRRDPIESHPDMLRYLGHEVLALQRVEAGFQSLIHTSPDLKTSLRMQQATQVEQVRTHLARWNADGRSEPFVGMAGFTENEKCDVTRGGELTLLEGVLGLDDTDLITFLANRRDALAPHLVAQEFTIENQTLRFRERIERAVRQQGLPADAGTVQRKVDATMLVSSDPLNLMPFQDAAYTARHRAGRVGVHLGIQGPQVNEAVRHELAHAVGGIAAIYNPAHPGTMAIRRSGLKVCDSEKAYFDWMSEPVAERLSYTLDRDDIDYRALAWPGMAADGTVVRYLYQENIMRAIMHGPYGTVPYYDVLAANFEDYNPSKPAGQREPMQQRLYEGIMQTWGGMANVGDFLYDTYQFNVTDERLRNPYTNPYLAAVATINLRRELLEP